MLDLDTELGALVKEELKRGWYAQAVNARARQMRIAQANAVLEHAHIEGVGQHVASIDAFAFVDWERRNPGITRDKDWLKSLLRDNPECRVNGTSAKTMVSFAGVSSDSVFSGSVTENCQLPTENSADSVEDVA